MLWSRSDDDKDRRARLARRVHEVWLSRAVEAGRAYPQIPLRAVSEGGYAEVVSSAAGRAWADGWWSQALELVD